MLTIAAATIAIEHQADDRFRFTTANDGIFRREGRRSSTGPRPPPRGTVTLRITRGRRTLASRRAQIDPGCAFRATLRRRRRSGRPTLSARFAGNTVGSAAQVSVRLRRA